MHNKQPKFWHIIYVKSRSEKKVLANLSKLNIQAYLPIVKVKKQWTDRVKTVEVPLFNSYVFVAPILTQRDLILQQPNVVKYLRYNKSDALLDNSVVNAIQNAIEKNKLLFIGAENKLNFEKGMQVTVIAGPFIGFKGQVVHIQGKNAVEIVLENLNQSIIVKINKNYLNINNATLG